MRAIFATGVLALLSGCTPGVYLNIYNATNDTVTIVKPQFRRTITIAILPHQAADVPLSYQPGSGIVIRDSRHTWTYSPESLFPPQSAYQQYTMVMRAFAKIDAHGRIYLLAPPSEGGSPREIPQPSGFPVKPQKT